MADSIAENIIPGKQIKILGKAAAASIIIGLTIIMLLFLKTPAAFAAEGAVYERVIAHGGGSYKGYETSNSVEALNNSIADGYKIIELDMELSSDHKIIMLHDWDRTAMHYFGTNFPKKLSQSQFMQLSVYGELEVLTFDKLAGILEKNQGVRIVTDTKGDNLELLAAISEKYPELVNRFIPQIYDCDQWSEVKELGYSDIILTLYAMADPDAERLASFVKEHEIYAVTMPDYIAERGICRQLTDEGIIVYIHPVSNYEEALHFIGQGAYGVYSGSLLPEEFAGIEKDYYLTVPDPDGFVVKLNDKRIDDWKELELHGRKPGETVLFYIDQSRQCANDSSFTDLERGKHKLTVKIFNRNILKGTLVYYLWKDTEKLRVVHKKYEYRLNAGRHEIDFHTEMQDKNISDEVREILENSLIAKEGDACFYFNGSQESYMNGDELLPVQKGSGGKLLLPMSTTLQRLGADSVMMSKGKDITINYNKQKSMIMVNSSIVRNGFRSTRLKNPVVLYLNKAMAGGEFYRCITGRNYIEKDGRIIILPGGAEPDKDMKEQLLQFSGKLF